MKAIVLLLSVYFTFAGAIDCGSNKISCSNGERCISPEFVCDSDMDCEDGSDEDPRLCSEWLNDECLSSEVLCHGDYDNDTYCISISEYCASDNFSCGADLDKRICMMLESGKLGNLENFVESLGVDNLKKSEELATQFQALIPNTLRHPDCPPMYTMVDGQCLSIFHIGSMSWAESREFCNTIGGDLMTFSSVSHYATVVRHLQKYELTSDLWIGGRMETASEGWTWIDGSPMELGSPFWAIRYSAQCIERNVTVAESEEVCFQYYQAPEAETKGQCVSLSFEQFFFMRDEDCVKKLSPLCIYLGDEDMDVMDEEGNSQENASSPVEVL